MKDRYKYLCELQAESDITLDQSIRLTELIKSGDCIETAIFLIEIINRKN
ncbi:MAG: hypothetical protein GY804_10055 [Alphaproteobacteria bacterium]|nr:hypothetical protein [Alphaproteobacteria bacterium]